MIWRVAGLPAIVAAAVFANTLANGLLYDDPLALAAAGAPLRTFAMRRIALTYATLHLEQLLWGPWQPGYHLTNVLLHALCSALAGVLALSLTGRPLPAVLCGLLFALHPVHVEAVASIENRKDLLAMAFVASSAILYRRPSWAAYAGALACFALALLAKDVAAAGLVGVLPLLDLQDERIPWRTRARRAALRVLPLLVLGAAGAAWFAGGVIARFSPDGIRAAIGPGFERYRDVVATAAASLPSDFRLLFFPLTLSADYPVVAHHFDGQAALGLALLIAWIAGTLRAVRWRPVVALGMAWTLLMLLPASNVVPLGEHFVAERYLYVPSFGVCLVAGALLGEAWERRRTVELRAATAALAAALMIGGGIRSIARNRDWRDNMSLWQNAPDGSARAHGEVGMALLDAGRWVDAIPHLERAIAVGPDKGDYENNLGLALAMAGRRDEAIAHFRRAADLMPDEPIVHFNLGRTLWEAGARREALTHLRESVKQSAWERPLPWTRAALRQHGMGVEDFRGQVQRWIAENGVDSIPPPP